MGRLEQLRLEMLHGDEMCWSKMWAWPEYFYSDCIASRWLFPVQVGCSTVLGLNASRVQIPSTSWRVRTLEACHSVLTWLGSVGSCVELQSVPRCRQPCGGLPSQGWLHAWLLSSTGLAKSLHCCYIFLLCCSCCWFGFLCVTRHMLMSVIVVYSLVLLALVMVACGVVWNGDSVPKWTVASVLKKPGEQSSCKLFTILLLTWNKFLRCYVP